MGRVFHLPTLETMSSLTATGPGRKARPGRPANSFMEEGESTSLYTLLALHCIALHYIRYIRTYIHALHYITLHYIALHCITLHYTTLHYIYITYIHTIFSHIIFLCHTRSFTYNFVPHNCFNFSILHYLLCLSFLPRHPVPLQHLLLMVHTHTPHTQLITAQLPHTRVPCCTRQSLTISFLFPAFPMPSLPFFCCLLEEVGMWGYPVL